jgi:hypothetical protein
VIEVAEHDVDAGALFTEGVGDRDANVGEGDVRGTGGGGVRGLYGFGLDTFTSGDKKNRESVL